MTLYRTGRVTVLRNTQKVTGISTEWLLGDIKSSDIFILNGGVYEISEVKNSTELTLTEPYTGMDVENVEYIIIKVADKVIAADIARKLQELVTNYNKREIELVTKVEVLAKYIQVLISAGLYVDTDGDIAQNDNLSGSILGDDVTLASPQDIQALLNELGLDGH